MIRTKCKYCGAEIKTYKSTNKKFCNSVCFRMSQADAVIIKKCFVCNKEFSTHRSKNQNCCSKECRHKWQSIILKKRIHKTCKNCGSNFETIPSKYEQKFCSYVCYIEHNKRTKNKCKVCGKTTNTNANVYCSKQCMAEDYKTKLLGNFNPNWKNNNINRKNSGISVSQRERILTRDNHECSECGMKDWDQVPSLLHIHHIEQYKDTHNNDDENLTTLCFVCHWVGQHGYKISKSLQEIATRQNCKSRYL